MLDERINVVTLQGQPITLIGPDIKEGDTAPEVTLVGENLSQISPLEHSNGKVRLFIILASLDTETCSMEAKKFSNSLGDLDNSVAVYIVSADLPFTQKRWCQAERVTNITLLSDYRSMEFARSWGLLVKELELPIRAVYVVNRNNKVTYREIVSEITSEPNYEAAIHALKVAAWI